MGPLTTISNMTTSDTTYNICSLNNMIPLRVDVHKLFDAHEIGIDIHVCLNYAFVRGSTNLDRCP